MTIDEIGKGCAPHAQRLGGLSHTQPKRVEHLITDKFAGMGRGLPHIHRCVGKRTTRDNTWNAVRVCTLRNSHEIAVYRDGERTERGEVNLEEAAQLLQVKSMTVLRLIQRKVLPAQQPCVGAPWSIRRDDLDAPPVRRALTGRYNGPLTPDPGQGSLDFQ